MLSVFSQTQNLSYNLWVPPKGCFTLQQLTAILDQVIFACSQAAPATPLQKQLAMPHLEKLTLLVTRLLLFAAVTCLLESLGLSSDPNAQELAIGTTLGCT